MKTADSKRSKWKTGFCLTLVFMQASCFIMRTSSNEPYPPERIVQIHAGKTTSTELVKLLGAPSHIVRLGKGRTAYLFEHSMTKTAGLWLVIILFSNFDQRSDRTWVFVDENQVVSHVATTLAAERTEYSMPWEDLHDEIPGQTPKK